MSKLTPEEAAFRKFYLFNMDEIMESIELTIDYYNNEHAYSENYRRNVTLLFSELLTKLKEVRLPELADRWKHYSYELAGDSLILSLCEAEDIELDNDGYIDSMSTINEHVLIEIEASYLTNSEFAKTHEVTVATVNKWIKRGKLKNAKFSEGVWLIPSIEERPQRGYQTVQYLLSDGKSPLTVERYPLVGISTSMFFYYNDEKECVSCSFANSENNLYEKMELSVEEAEELEYQIILSGNYETAGRAQFVPMLEKYDL